MSGSLTLRDLQSGTLPPIENHQPTNNAHQDWHLQSINSNTVLSQPPHSIKKTRSKYIVDIDTTTSSPTVPPTTAVPSKNNKQKTTYDRKRSRIEKHTTIQLDMRRQKHQLNMQKQRQRVFARDAGHYEKEKIVSFEFTQRLQSLSLVHFKQLSTLDQAFRKRQIHLDRRLISNLSKVRGGRREKKK